jgi:hypothetical protein
MATLPCPDGAGSINNLDGAGQVPNTPYALVAPCTGDWELGGDDDCAIAEKQNQAAYAAENININGAPLRIYKLLGVHEQGDGSLLSKGSIFTSQAEPGFPGSNINSGSGVWHSIQSGSGVTAVAYVGVDFSIVTRKTSNESAYKPIKPSLQKVGCVTIQQGNTAFNFARQLRVDITDGKISVGLPQFISNGGTGTLNPVAGPDAEEGTISVFFTSSTSFAVTYVKNIGSPTLLGTGTVDLGFKSTIAEFTVTGTFVSGDSFVFPLNYEWKRIGVFNVSQSGAPVILNLQREYLAKAVRVVPTLYTGTNNWEVISLDVLDSPPTNDVNVIQDLFYNENRDRDYAKVPINIKAQYQISDSITDLSKFGLNILDQYSFIVSYPVMVQLLGRPIVTGDIIEVVPELQYDQNLKPVRKYVEVTDTGWASSGYSSTWSPSLYRFAAQQALPSQETRDIFGTLDTQKYLTADSFLADLGSTGGQLDTTPLTQTEEIIKTAQQAVPETGDDMGVSVAGVPEHQALDPVNLKGQPEPVNNFKQNLYIEDGLPPNNQPYGEGFILPETTTASDGDWFRLYYPEATNIAPRLYRFSALKNKWLFMEQDRRTNSNSARPSISKILKSDTKHGLNKK